jgi:hypothetical protein
VAAELNAHQVETGRGQSTSTTQEEQGVVYLRLIWLTVGSVENVTISRERSCGRELVTFSGI